MKIIIVQLSDIHLKDADNLILDQVDAIKRAICGVEPSAKACLIAMTGDVAFSGSEAEYQAAHAFFDHLHKGIASTCPDVQLEEVFIPGNHDCFLPDQKMTSRRLIMEHLVKDTAPADRPETSLVQECLEAQKNFFAFLAARPNGQRYPTAQEPGRSLHYSVDVTIADRHIRFECFNTAWMSQRHEQPGQLLAPTWDADNAADSDLAITLFHHPYNWLDPVNAKAFRQQVERLSDIVMTGHEHVAEHYSKETIRGDRNEYFEGAVLQESGSPESGFNIIIIDLDQRECRVVLYGWQDGHYAVREQGLWRTFDRNRRHGLRPFESASAFADKLNDVGVVFSHPKGTLRLSDIFVYPTLEDQPYAKDKPEKALKTIKGDSIHEYIKTHPHVLLMGGERCGRTSLAKTLYQDFLRQGYVPILLSGEQLKRHEAAAFGRVVDLSVEEQYGQDMVERFRQLEPAGKVLIIDDVHRCLLNAAGLNALMECAGQSFGSILLLADDLFQIEQITHAVDEQVALLSFRHCSIKPFGHRLRHELIERWYSLGQEYTASQNEIAEKTRNAEQLVNTLIGKNLLPSYPLFVLTILQSYEASTYHNTALGAYGYHYEALITAALAKAIDHAKSRLMVGTIYTFVSTVADRLFQQKRKHLSESEMRQAVDDYRAKYGMRFSDAEMLSVLLEARILAQEPDGRYRFRYPYIYYYFVARYINDHLRTRSSEGSLRERVAEMTRTLYVEENANVIIFLVYLTKDEGIIGGILAHARTLYAEHEPCDLDSHLAFVKHLTGKPLPLQLDDGSLQAHNDEYRDQLDEADELDLPAIKEVQAREDRIKEDQTKEDQAKQEQVLDDVLKINAALKTLEVMGQVLRNFPGSLPGDLKLEIATESYMLGLRTLQMIYSRMEENLENYRLFFSEVIRHVRLIENPKDLAKTTDQFLYWMVFGCSYGLIKRVSQAVGSEQLEETFKQVTDPRSPVSVALIDLSIKLDHFRHFPMGEVESTKELAKRNPFATSILRCFVRDHLYLYPVSRQTRQEVCAKLDITVNDPNMLLTNKKHIESKAQ